MQLIIYNQIIRLNIYYNENKREPYNLNEDKTKVNFHHILISASSFTIKEIEYL